MSREPRSKALLPPTREDTAAAQASPRAGANVRHSSATVEHYSPSLIVEAARRTLGAIDLDPASCAMANRTVQASAFYSKEQDGLRRWWEGRVFLNPPGGKVAGKSQQKAWWTRLATSYKNGEIDSAIFIGFSLEILQTSQVGAGEVLTPHAFPRCYPARRIAYLDRNGQVGKSPPHASVIIYLPPGGSFKRSGLERFDREFTPIGALGAPFTIEAMF